ncbi:ribonuclease HI [Spirochaeta isovalerica]|uniref:Ribonuclease H n=1 Tax=Spirochaeta isovalerica TaxID=150 RepID=A0A841R8D8_9SPIO|nr:ribonuclease HI [Spirochaeta isovalerica]MBB6478998.1 ribonuclease HI [Spirochaeta isovalerica]
MNDITVYTDGGCTGNPGPGGWAAVLLYDGNEVRLSGGEESTTNNKMELTAVIKALSHINENSDLRNRKVEIFTDSQYVKNGLTQWIFNWIRNGWKTAAKKPVKNKEFWLALKNEADKLELMWNWVKGHSGDEYNELCDSLVEEERLKFS